jgi:hypothetical protein
VTVEGLTFEVLLGRGDGTFAKSASGEPDELPGTRSLVAADVTEDGLLDLVVPTQPIRADQGVMLLRGRADGTFAAGILQLVRGIRSAAGQLLPWVTSTTTVASIS